RDATVTGVKTCALPISSVRPFSGDFRLAIERVWTALVKAIGGCNCQAHPARLPEFSIRRSIIYSTSCGRSAARVRRRLRSLDRAQCRPLWSYSRALASSEHRPDEDSYDPVVAEAEGSVPIGEPGRDRPEM